MGIFIAAAIFILDTQLPLGVADGVLYVALVLIGLRSRSKKYILWSTVCGTTLIATGFFLSPSGGELWNVLTNRALAVFTLWMTALLCLWQVRVEKKLREASDEQEQRVRDRTAKLDEINELLRQESGFVELHKDIAVASNETQAIEKTLEYCLKRICAHAGWPVGHLYLTAEPYSYQLVPAGIWYLEDPARFSTFRKITEATPFKTGEGLPGRVIASGKAAWIIDVTKDPNFPRAMHAQKIDVKAAFAFPVLIGNEIVGVMEFFSSKAAELDSKMLEIMEQMGTQLGRVLERKRAEEDQQKLLGSLKERVKELTTMYGVANLVSTSKTMHEALEKIGSFIIPGMQFPDITQVKINYDYHKYRSGIFKETPWKLSGDIVIQGKSHGSLDIYYTQQTASANDDPFLNEERDMIAGLARLLSVAGERLQAEEEIRRSREQLRNLYHRLELIREEERTRMAREIHDELAQVLTALKLEVSLLDRKLLKNTPSLQSYTQMMLKLIDTTIQTGKKLALDLRPPLLDDLGIGEAIEWEAREYERRTGIKCEVEMNKNGFELDKERSTTLFRIFQEALTNVTRHAKADAIHIKLTDENDRITLQVADNGIGISKKQLANLKSLGLLGMRERALVWGGKVDIIGVPNKGTTVTIHLNRESL